MGAFVVLKEKPEAFNSMIRALTSIPSVRKNSKVG